MARVGKLDYCITCQKLKSIYAKQRCGSCYRRWHRTNNPHIIYKDQVVGNNYRSNNYGLPSLLTVEDWLKVLEYWEYSCAICGETPKKALCIDHWYPFTSPKCEGTVISNVIPLCSKCNSSKSDLDPLEWLLRHFPKADAYYKYSVIEAYRLSIMG